MNCTIIPEPNEQSEQSPVQARPALPLPSRAGPQLGSVPSLGISARLCSFPSRVSRAELALLALPSLLLILVVETRDWITRVIGDNVFFVLLPMTEGVGVKLML